MEEFKKFEEITNPDIRHISIGNLTGRPYSLESIYKAIENEELNKTVPEVIRSQFNVLKNLIIYSWYSYPLGAVADLKSFVLIEHALKEKFKDEKLWFSQLVKKAVDEGIIKDSGFRHIELGDDPQEYSRRLPKILPNLRNELAHGSNYLDFNCISGLKICADFINQLF